ncbi:radical SAM protein [Peptococcus simiae]|uniref:Radical SAM protein n=1 Tax=Peptococcus simiae TaxID=1643805 RepID=A0ABW9H2N2_9FIRM
MVLIQDLNRYGIVPDKCPREIVLLRGSGCKWSACRYCDYHLDRSSDPAANYALNAQALAQVDGRYQHLEAVNSGSFCDLDAQTVDEIFKVCQDKGIHTLTIECHWRDRDSLPALRDRCRAAGISLKVSSGIETFDGLVREAYLNKGIPADVTPADLAQHFDQTCLLFGLPGQHLAQMTRDLAIGLTYFDRVTLNIFTANSRQIQPDPGVIALFKDHIYPLIKDNSRVDILMENTDFGIG